MRGHVGGVCWFGEVPSFGLRWERAGGDCIKRLLLLHEGLLCGQVEGNMCSRPRAKSTLISLSIMVGRCALAVSCTSTDACHMALTW